MDFKFVIFEEKNMRISTRRNIVCQNQHILYQIQNTLAFLVAIIICIYLWSYYNIGTAQYAIGYNV